MAAIEGGRPSLVPAPGQNGSHKALGLKGLGLRYRGRLYEAGLQQGHWEAHTLEDIAPGKGVWGERPGPT